MGALRPKRNPLLLPQPCRLEGLFKGGVSRGLHDPPVFEAQDMTLPQIGEHTAAFPLCAEAEGDGGALVALDDALHFEAERLPWGEHRLPERAHASMAAIDRREVGEEPLVWNSTSGCSVSGQVSRSRLAQAAYPAWMTSTFS